MNKKTSIKLNSGNIINIRKNLDNEISKGWKVIINENIMTTREIKAGLGSGKDLKALYNHITQLQEKRVLIKGMLMYLNLGITTFNEEEFKKTNNYSIFKACEAKETFTKLSMIKTLNPTEKAKKGKANMTKKETFTSAKIGALKNELQLEINKYDAALEKFNKETDIDITSIADKFALELTI